MRVRGLFHLLVVLAVASLAGCSDYDHRERPPWRAQAEQACIAQGLVHETASIRASRALDGPGICGVDHPFKVTALADGSVTLNSTQTLDCPMIAALDRWVREVVQPAAQARFGEPVVKISSMGSYSCRGINNMSGASLSEHSFANAIDIGGFVLASGRELDIRRGFNGADEQERAFLHEAHAGACSYFTTVLGPGYNIFHYNHFHMDLAMHGMTSRGPRRYCKPVPQTRQPEAPARDTLPDPPPIEEEMDIARAPVPAPALRSGPPTLVASVPPSPVRRAGPPEREEPAEVPDAASVRPVTRVALDPPGPVAPRAGGTEPPLISFAEPELPSPARRTGIAPVIPAAELRAPGADPPPPAAARRREGLPQDWDATSSIGR